MADEQKNELSLDKAILKGIIACACFLAPLGAGVCWLLRASLPGRFMQGYVAGLLLGLANMYFLSLMVVSVVNAAGVRKGQVTVGLLGINATIIAMLFIAWKKWVGALGLTAGFTLALVAFLASVFIFSKKN